MRIPRWLVLAWDAFGDWANVPAYRTIRRIDLLLAFFFLVCVGWYWFTSGWLGALTGGLFYIFMVLCAVWFF